MRFFHASPRRFKVGTVLTHTAGRSPFVFLTTSPMPHYTIMGEALEGAYHVYEVRPIGKVRRGLWDDIVCRQAEVVRYVGTARGILQARTRGRAPKNWAGSSVRSRWLTLVIY